MEPINSSEENIDNAALVCAHLLDQPEPSYFQYFTGEGAKIVYICWKCAELPEPANVELYPVNSERFQYIEEEGCWEGIVGKPAITERSTSLRFEHRSFPIVGFDANNMLDIQPVLNSSKSEWIALTADNNLIRIELSDSAKVTTVGRVTTPDNQLFTAMELAPDGKLAAVFQATGLHGVVVELESIRQLKQLERDGYHNGASTFPVAFFIQGERTLLVYGSKWNRLDICDPITDELLTPREYSPYEKGGPLPQHYLDYFHGKLVVSPDQQWIANDGWVWGPAGIPSTWNLKRWLTENTWESEDGGSKFSLPYRHYFWGGPICWINDRTVAIWGYGLDDEWLLPAVRLFDVISKQETGWFPGPEVSSDKGLTVWEAMGQRRDSLIFDIHLFSISASKGMQIWDLETGDLLFNDSSFFPSRYHQGTKEFLSISKSGTLQVSRLVGDSLG